MPPDVAIPRGVDAWMTIEANVSTMPNPAFQAAARDQLEVVARLRSGIGVQAAARAGRLEPLPALRAE